MLCAARNRHIVHAPERTSNSAHEAQNAPLDFQQLAHFQVHGRNARTCSGKSHFDSERAHPGRSAQRNPNGAGYSAPFSLSGAAAAWKAALHARQTENCWKRTERTERDLATLTGLGLSHSFFT
jgi:hypothetical protein